jgi:hypothetical protein
MIESAEVSLFSVLKAIFLIHRRVLIIAFAVFSLAALGVTSLASNVILKGGTGHFEDPNVLLYVRMILLLVPTVGSLVLGASIVVSDVENGGFRFTATQAVKYAHFRIVSIGTTISLVILGLLPLAVADLYFQSRDQVVRSQPDWSLACVLTRPSVVIAMGVATCLVGIGCGYFLKRGIRSIALGFGTLIATALLIYEWWFDRLLRMMAVVQQTPYLTTPNHYGGVVLNNFVLDRFGNHFAPIWSPGDFARLAATRSYTHWTTYVAHSRYSSFVHLLAVSLIAPSLLFGLIALIRANGHFSQLPRLLVGESMRARTSRGTVWREKKERRNNES